MGVRCSVPSERQSAENELAFLKKYSANLAKALERRNLVVLIVFTGPVQARYAEPDMLQESGGGGRLRDDSSPARKEGRAV